MIKAKADSFASIHDRRIADILDSLGTDSNRYIAAWSASLDENGKWPDSEVDYTTGCAARRANWPAQAHWQRIDEANMARAWHGDADGTGEYAGDESLKSKISLAMDYWYSRDFTDLACLDSGGKPGSTCTCDNPDNLLWNANWFSNVLLLTALQVILIPRVAALTSLLMGSDNLSSSQVDFVKRMVMRSYEYNVAGITGANTLDISRIGMDLALLTGDADFLAACYDRSHKELTIMNDVRADGIRADGAFGQHDGMLYNGNYGKDYLNDILGIEIEAAGTEFTADASSQAAYETLFEGDTWMLIRNTVTGLLHWDFSALGRFISFPVADPQGPTSGIRINLDAVAELGSLWNSATLSNFASSLSAPSNVNAGGLVGNRMFYTNDYMVHRGENYVSTLKMWSNRTRHTECTNSQNPLGFHLADGVTYNYIRGDEYEDIAGAWDWNIPPGITTDYGATPLNCDTTRLLGIEGFVGGASDGQVGVAAMRYKNPVTKKLQWQKAWFYLEGDMQHVIVSGISRVGTAPVISVLDQRRHDGPVIVNGLESDISTYKAARTLWHGGVGYQFVERGAALSLNTGVKDGNWSKIGTTSVTPIYSVDLFSAWIRHEGRDATSTSYTVFPGTTAYSFACKANEAEIRTIQSDIHISAIVDDTQETSTVMAVFWDVGGGSFTYFPDIISAPLTITVNGNVALIYRTGSGSLTVSDPSQQLTSVQVTLTLGVGLAPSWWNGDSEKTLSFTLPDGGLAGSSVTQQV
ncbi:hypothetical protein H0H92_010809 [Tricholoma furcatifolium]|nr:hypothetical protein H0H92_010809 [Tricholoma furcatifolium]